MSFTTTDCEQTKHSSTPTCFEEVSHWNSVVSQLGNKNDDPELTEKAQFKLRCYLNWCMGQKDFENTRIQFKACCKSNQEQIEERLNKESWGQDQLPEVLSRAQQYLNYHNNKQ